MTWYYIAAIRYNMPDRHDYLVSLNVNNTRESMEELKRKGYPFIGEAKPFRDSEYAFIHPRAVNNVLLEIID